ncbi:Hypothetical predicted protein [Podarcis lilfordi]|uniref:Uncharacterized protein n=1 Tax=Podarcis lilfordi TaxID=74358 RepID=A0AA35P7N7_9SAUR|nr:Hypothetical predicted protein [Podarcis lilfordi]
MLILKAILKTWVAIHAQLPGAETVNDLGIRRNCSLAVIQMELLTVTDTTLKHGLSSFVLRLKLCKTLRKIEEYIEGKFQQV